MCDHPFADDVDDLVSKFVCDICREGVTAFLLETAIPVRAPPKNA